MERLENIMSALTLLMENKKKHVLGGVLLSVSLLFGGLAVTVIFIKNEENDDNEQQHF